ncbi:ABC transporter ATP-binding protein [Schlesneria paludicola]|uniref:ABC transporter ATP-binding protein n=1 Tax=Schlesneria paludicola TaxID=360056 RepID=UPI000299E95E|nr:ABC transporter ATP-binding protein [Schlesneria paludicola]
MTALQSLTGPPTHPTETLAVACRQIIKEFGVGDTKTVALRGVDLDVLAGQMTLLVGQSGCGKTTLISIVAGLLNATSGSLTVLGNDMMHLTGTQLVQFRQKNIGFVFQQYNLLPTLSAVENAAVPLIIAGQSRRAAFEAAKEILSAVGLGSRMHLYPNQLSGGQQQRVAIARALVHEPRLLVCDEPTAALDAQSGQTVMELLRRVALQPDRAVIVVTHDNRVFRFGDRIIHMDDGVVTKVDIPDRASGGDPESTMH